MRVRMPEVTATMATMSNFNVQMLEHTRTIEANQVNEYEFHLSGTIDMLGKLQKKLDAELPDAQEGENNAAEPISFNSVRGTPWYLVPGIVWQCFPEHLQNELCSATPKESRRRPT